MTDSRDTSPNARDVQLAIFRSLAPSARLGLACEMSDEARAIAEAGLRYRNPAWPSERVASALRDLMLGDALARRLRSGWAPARR